MREQLINLLLKQAKVNERLMLLTNDMGFHFVERFAAAFPKQYINCGVCEQAMVGQACGIADEGYEPYLWGTANFLIFRPYEQIRNDVCYGNRQVKLIGVTGSADYKKLGFTHNLAPDEDIRALAQLPNMTIYTDLNHFINHKGPAYLKL